MSELWLTASITALILFLMMTSHLNKGRGLFLAEGRNARVEEQKQGSDFLMVVIEGAVKEKVEFKARRGTKLNDYRDLIPLDERADWKKVQNKKLINKTQQKIVIPSLKSR